MTIALQNGSTIVKIDLTRNTKTGSGTDQGFHGYVLAQTAHGEYVTWCVSSRHDGDKLDAYSGAYHRSDYSAAVTDYDTRRASTMVPTALLERAELAR